MSLRSRLSTSARVALAVTAVLVLGVSAVSAVAYFRITDRLRSDLDRSLLRESEAFSAAIERPASDTRDLTATTRSYIEARSASYSSSHPILLVRFSGGHVLSNSEVRVDRATANMPALDPAKASRAFIDFTWQGEAYRAATVPVRDATGTPVAVFEAALPVGPTADIATQLLLTLAVTGGLVVIAGAALSAVVARASLGPLRRAAASAERIGMSTLTDRVGYDGPDDEAGKLVAAINAMLDRLEAAFAEQRRFVADASHELRTPLAVVSGHLELLADPRLTGPERDEEIALLADETARMRRLVEDLLALARLDVESGTKHQPLEVRVLLEEAAARCRVLGECVIDVQSPDGLWVAGDPDQLMQAVVNLTGNAATYAGSGAHITLAAVGDGSWVSITVRDDGPGFRPEDLPRVFDRFYRSQGPRSAGTGGSGLGLAIVARLVELHGGTVSASNGPGGGASVTMRLPKIAPPR